MENEIMVSRVNLKENWQELLRLENKYLQAIGEQTLTEENQEQLFHAIQDEKITFFSCQVRRASCRNMQCC